MNALLATAAACVVLGWPLARSWAPTDQLLASVVLSLTTLFLGSLTLQVCSLPIGWPSLAVFQVALFAAGLLALRGSTPPAAPAEPLGLRLPTCVLAGVCLALLLARAWLHPLPGYDTAFRWGRLAELLFREHNLDFYPPRTPAHFELYFYPDAVPPMVSLVYAELYSLLGRIAPEATMWFMGLQGVLLAAVAMKLARIWGGPAAAEGALLALCATPLVFWAALIAVAVGQIDPAILPVRPGRYYRLGANSP